MVHWFFKLIKMVQAIFKVFFVGLNSVIEKLNQKKKQNNKTNLQIFSTTKRNH